MNNYLFREPDTAFRITNIVENRKENITENHFPQFRCEHRAKQNQHFPRVSNELYALLITRMNEI